MRSVLNSYKPGCYWVHHRKSPQLCRLTLYTALHRVLHPCLGFAKTDRHCKVSRHQTEYTAVTEIDVNGKAHLISNACGLVIRKKDSFFQGCTAAQRLLRKRKTEFKNLKWTRNSVLGAQELCHPCNIPSSLLNASGIHFNETGTKQLAKSLIASIRGTSRNRLPFVGLVGPDESQVTNRSADFNESLITNIIPSKGLVMAAININRLTTHIDELRLFIAQEKIDILAINETKLDDLVGNNDIYIPGYEIVRKDRVTKGHNGGGVCFYIRSNLNYNVRQDLQHEKLEFLAVEINNPHSKPFLVSTWYRPQRTPWPVPEIFSIFENLVAKIDAENIEFYLLGDANANLLPGSHDSISRSLLNVLDIYGLSQLITKPTRVTATSESLIGCMHNKQPRKNCQL